MGVRERAGVSEYGQQDEQDVGDVARATALHPYHGRHVRGSVQEDGEDVLVHVSRLWCVWCVPRRHTTHVSAHDDSLAPRVGTAVLARGLWLRLNKRWPTSCDYVFVLGVVMFRV